MPSSESGDPNNYPTSFDKPSDGDGPTIKAADVNVALEALADRTAWLKAHLIASADIHVYTTSQTIVAPAGVVAAIVRGCGGGGAGGSGGSPGTAGVAFRISGAGGGGGALEGEEVVPITAGDSYAIAIGAGGVGAVGTSTDTGNDGANGEDTTLSHVGVGLVAAFTGAAGGTGARQETHGFGTLGVRGGVLLVPGGSPVYSGVADPIPTLEGGTGDPSDPTAWSPFLPDLNAYTAPHRGGPGVTNNISNVMRAGGSVRGFHGGLSGTITSPPFSGAYCGGGSGGGGGAGPYGAGGDGGKGGKYNASGLAPTAGAANGPTAGGAGGANTGAGGGGGGSGGAASSSGSVGGAGGDGGSGKLTIIWLRGA